MDQTLRIIPVQCIEHWLWYAQDISSKPGTLENKTREEAKMTVWGSKRPTDERRQEVIATIRPNFDIERLESRSASFRHFHHQVQKFLSENETSS